MLKINEQIAKDLERLEQLKRHNGKLIQIEKTVSLDEDIRRQIIIGEMVSDFFPEVLQFQPKEDETDNQSEFSPLARFLSLLKSDEKYVKQLIEKATTDFN